MTTRIPDWVSGKRYFEDEAVIVKGEAAAYNDKLYRVLADHTSFSFQTDFGNSFWELIQTRGIEGPQGNAGVVGPAGADGNDGAQGPAGGDGSDGLITAIATKSEAEVGVENTAAMTALRTKEAIDFQLSAERLAITNNTTENAKHGGADGLNTRIVVLENAAGTNLANGHQRLLNTNGPEDILGLDAPSGQDGKGNRLELNSVGARSARVQVEVYRKDDVETRVSTCTLILQFVPPLNTWFVERESTTVIEGNPDGVVFGITTANPAAGIYVGQINYTTDTMAGGNYDIDSYVRFIIREITNIY